MADVFVTRTSSLPQRLRYLALGDSYTIGEGVLVVPGSSFNVPYRNHFRVTLLPDADTMREVFARIDRVLTRRAEAATKVVPINKPKSRPAAA